MQMSVESIAALAAAQAGVGGTGPGGGTTQTMAAPDTFATLMRREVGELDANVGAAEGALRDLAAGRSVELHEVMIAMERARLSVQTFVQIRNKLIESYQDLMRMQM